MPVRRSDYREKLVDLIKVSANTILNNAENIVARVPYNTGFDISIHFGQGFSDTIPTIEVTQTFFPDVNELNKVLFKTEAKEA